MKLIRGWMLLIIASNVTMVAFVVTLLKSKAFVPMMKVSLSYFISFSGLTLNRSCIFFPSFWYWNLCVNWLGLTFGWFNYFSGCLGYVLLAFLLLCLWKGDVTTFLFYSPLMCFHGPK